MLNHTVAFHFKPLLEIITWIGHMMVNFPACFLPEKPLRRYSVPISPRIRKSFKREVDMFQLINGILMKPPVKHIEIFR